MYNRRPRIALAETADVSAKRIKPTRSLNVSGAVEDMPSSQSVWEGTFGTVAPDGYVKYPYKYTRAKKIRNSVPVNVIKSKGCCHIVGHTTCLPKGTIKCSYAV